RVHGRRRRGRAGALGQLRRAAAAGAVPADHQAARRGLPPPGQPGAGAEGRAAAPVQAEAGTTDRGAAAVPVAIIGGIGLVYIAAWGIGYTTFPVWWELIHTLAAHGDTVQVPGWIAWWTPNPVLGAQSVPSLAVSFALVPGGLFALIWSPWIVSGGNDLDRR